MRIHLEAKHKEVYDEFLKLEKSAFYEHAAEKTNSKWWVFFDDWYANHLHTGSDAGTCPALEGE